MNTRILVIDDDRLFDRALERAIVSAEPNIQVVTATAGAEGIALANRMQPDVIVLDIHLARESGWTVAEQLSTAESTRTIPIIVASGVGAPFEGSAPKGRQMIAGYLRKPYNAAQLLATIEQALA